MNMKVLQKTHYKERDPRDTVLYLKKILQNAGVEIREEIVPKSSIDTYSMRVTLKGTELGANGKGVSEDYMKASAYAELTERLQNGHMNPWGWYPRHPGGFWHCPDERWMSSLEIAELSERQSFLQYYFKYRGWAGLNIQEKASCYEKLHRVEYQFGMGRDTYETRPFYNVKYDRVEYLPYYLYLLHYASNGMCAGNTPEEALVQGFCEIMERHVQKKIFVEKPCFPDIPDVYIQKFPEIWKKIQKLRSIPGIRAWMKDGSFEGRYPVAVLLLVNENTGNYGVKLGCHPDFGIAMERTLTEATQGADVDVYANRSWIDFNNTNVDSDANIYNSYKFGQAQYPYELFGEKSSWSFVTPKDVSEMDNRQLLEELTHKFLEEGYEILIRDVSYLGFPSFQIVIPEFSELQLETDLKAKVYNTRAYLASYLAYPERIGKTEAKLLLGVLDYWSGSPMENQMCQIYSMYPDGKFPAEDMRMGWQYLAAMCCVVLNDDKSAARRIAEIVRLARICKNDELDFYLAVYHYFVLRANGKEHPVAVSYVSKFFDEEVTHRVDTIFSEREKVLIKQYNRYDYQKIDQEKDARKGEYAVWTSVREKLLNFQWKHQPDQTEIRNIFRGITWKDGREKK